MTMTSPILAAESIVAGYGDVRVLRDVDIAIGAGEVVALLGANGAGKTTTLLALSGELHLMAGHVRWQGRTSREKLYRRARQGLAFVTEERSVFMRLTGEENLRLGKGGVKGALAVMPDLERLLDRPAGLMSGGEQQFLTLARALATKPSVLLADELSLGLAPIMVETLLSKIREAADQGTGVLLVEQHIGSALSVADRVYVMQRGRIVLQGPADEIRARLDEVEDSYLSGL
jgi:branched-chain amino acid transport system ATP-binding protein